MPILSQLDPIAHGVEAWGWDLARGAIEHRYMVGVLVTALIVPIALAARRSERRVGWAAAALLAATWGQILLFSDLIVPGVSFYSLAIVAAVVFGIANPLRPSGAAAPLWLDVTVLAGLTILAVVVRVYALDQLPAFVDIEPALAFFESLSPYGLAHYVAHNRVDDDGFAHMLARAAVQQVTGPSVVSIRLAGVLFNAMAVPICYALVRQLTGVFPAALAGLLLLSAPEQLIFARIEATQIAAVSAAALITAHVVLRLAREWSTRAALATALWMPFTRYFYAPSIVLFLLPLGTALHALCFGPWRRRAATASVILLGGTVLWLGASPALRYAATGQWAGASSLRIYGISFYEPFAVEETSPERTAVVPMLRFQVERFLTNGADLVAQLAYDRPGFSTFYLREHPDERHKRSVHAALLIPFVAGLGYLLARWRDSRAALLLLWVFLGILPAVMSDDVDPRRLSVFYPAVAVIAGVFIDVFMRAVQVSAPRLAARPLRAALAAAAAFIVITSLAAHLRVHRDVLQYTEYIEFARPYFETSDVIFHNVQDVNTIGIIAFGNAEPFRRRLPGFHYVGDWDAEWQQVTDEIGCPFDHPLFSTLASEAALAERCASFHPARVTYLLRIDSPDEQAVARRLRARFPGAEARQMRGRPQDDPIRSMFALTVER
jgi:hypothetical protein